ncbi:MAG: hypothetical protein M1834_000563 [Cirrosporium novae-zelandiae]|nr:MAG: hypothetical protein M1834_000563 [Cirrosporium novae-zelandiae]
MSTPSPPITPRTTFTIDTVTILSLLSFVLLILIAHTTSTVLLPAKTTPFKTRLLYLWHALDGLCHLTIEASWLYNCFFIYHSLPPPDPACGAHSSAVTPPNVYFLNRPDRLYGPAYGDGATALLWQEYAKADKRWGGSDLSLISLEILTAAIAGPGALFICYLLVKSKGQAFQNSATLWFTAVVVAWGEIYGSFITFAPEWLSGSPNLDTSNWMYMWLYLTFFNGLWILFPGWVLWEAWSAMGVAFGARGEGKKVV